MKSYKCYYTVKCSPEIFGNSENVFRTKREAEEFASKDFTDNVVCHRVCDDKKIAYYESEINFREATTKLNLGEISWDEYISLTRV